MKVRGKIDETILVSILSKISALYGDSLLPLVVLIFSGGISDRSPQTNNPPIPLKIPRTTQEAAILLVLAASPERH
jgi:hypothetical protein